MTFRGGASGDSNVSGGGGGRRGLAIGGGLGGIVVALIAAFIGVNPDSIPGLGAGGGIDGGGGEHDSRAAAIQQHIDEVCEKNSATANDDDVCRIVWATRSIDDVWTQVLPREGGKRYEPGKATVFEGSTGSGCGQASSATGPFYCPPDKRSYYDTSFFEDLGSKYGGSSAPAAQMYVVAHEYGHHIQNLQGTLSRAQRDPRGPQSGAVRIEVQADCYAGIWAHHATRTRASDGGAPLLAELSEADIAAIVKTAEAIGDDTIQAMSGTRVNPSAWTHGSAEMRKRWFLRGYREGTMASCDSFSTDDL